MQRSESIANLVQALAKAQASMKNPVHDSQNPHFRSRYSSLAAVRDAVIPPLAAHGLAVTQPITTEGDAVSCETVLMHESGEFLSMTTRFPVAQVTPQGYGSASTYVRRYSLMALCCVAGDADDDGEHASTVKPPETRSQGQGAPKGQAPNGQQPRGSAVPAKETALPYIAQIEAAIEAHHGNLARWYAWAEKKFGKAAAQFTESEYQQFLQTVRETSKKTPPQKAQGSPQPTNGTQGALGQEESAAPFTDDPGDAHGQSAVSAGDWRGQLADLLQGLEDATLKQEAASVLEDADATEQQGQAMTDRVLWGLESQQEEEKLPF